MRYEITQFVKLVAETVPISGCVYEFGALQVSGDPDLEDLRRFFPEQKYVGCDMRSGPGVDLVLNLHDIELEDDSVGCAVCMDTLEHVEFPRKAISEIYRILEPGGIGIFSSVMNFPIHGYPNDYWRFTPEGFKSLMRVFDKSLVGSVGPDLHPTTVVSLVAKTPAPKFDAFESGYNSWKIYFDAITRTLMAKDKD